MARKFVCQWCKEKDYDENMQLVLHGSQKKRYHIDGCYATYKKDKEFKDKEKQEKDELVEVIKDVHGIKNIPQQLFPMLEDIRNGNELFGKIGKKKKKEGYGYPIISATYKKCQPKIDTTMRRIDFNSTLGMLKYTIKIIKDNIDIVAKQVKQREEVEKQKSLKQNVEIEIDEQDIKFNQKKSNDDLDISKFL